MIKEIQKYDPKLKIEPKDCILRIHKGIRFSKDKSPYNLHYTAFISRGGRKNKSVPGIFLRFSPEMVGIMGGCFSISKERLHNVRIIIGQNPSGFRKLVEDNKAFVQTFEEIKGSALKRIPKNGKRLTGRNL
ncbi:DUF2461 family protein [uncultured Aquimarina sp.]|uniref:DUF2461 family protein n=1 Tax=uncultured Aquimarina sp. TaxID=575652 RepID=UPI0026142442|nr:DUF2461 family protein [uncultured Aquimarina sp.]